MVMCLACLCGCGWLHLATLEAQRAVCVYRMCPYAYFVSYIQHSTTPVRSRDSSHFWGGTWLDFVCGGRLCPTLQQYGGPYLIGPMVHTKNYIFRYFYRHYLVLFPRVLRNSFSLSHLPQIIYGLFPQLMI